MKAAGKSDTGRKRPTNQDNFFVSGDGTDFVIAAVCDGMGGHVGGEVASGIAVKAIRGALGKLGKHTEKELIGAHMNAALEKANREVFAESLVKEELQGMGTTAVAACLSDGILFLSHVGDSRAYVLRADGKFAQVTKDHSYVQEMIDHGELTPEQAENSPYKHLITRALGVAAYVTTEQTMLAFGPGDRLLLCSDGLSNMVSRDDLARLLSCGDEPEAICDGLIAAANENGGTDNITAVVVLHGNGERI